MIVNRDLMYMVRTGRFNPARIRREVNAAIPATLCGILALIVLAVYGVKAFLHL